MLDWVGPRSQLGARIRTDYLATLRQQRDEHGRMPHWIIEDALRDWFAKHDVPVVEAPGHARPPGGPAAGASNGQQP